MVYIPTEEERSKSVTIECKGGDMNDGQVIQNMINIDFCWQYYSFSHV